MTLEGRAVSFFFRVSYSLPVARYTRRNFREFLSSASNAVDGGSETLNFFFITAFSIK